MEIIQKPNRIIVKSENNNIVVPSKMYPLESNKVQLFTYDNTVSVVDEKLMKIFDEVKSERGKCFTNSKLLCDKLVASGYNAKQYIGWVFLDDVYPVHHSFVVLDKYIFDNSVDFTSEDVAESQIKYNCKTKQELRYLVVEKMKKLDELPNHKRFVFGKCKKQCFILVQKEVVKKEKHAIIN